MHIKTIRERSGKTQQEMAVELSVSVRSVARWESEGKEVDDLHPLYAREVQKFAKRHHVQI